MEKTKRKPGISTAIFGTSIILLLLVAGAGFALYATKPSVAATVTQTAPTVTSTEVMNHTSTMTERMNEPAIVFTPQPGNMIHDAILLVAPLASGRYAFTIHAGGLESPQMGAYLVEGIQRSGSMTPVPVAANATASEFEAAAKGGEGQFFTVLNGNPLSQFKMIEVFFLPGMVMANATLVASANLSG